MKVQLITVSLLAVVLYSCSHRSYLQSPLQANTNSYKAIPLQSEGIKAATYASGAITTGSANYNWRDENVGFIGSIHRSHNFGGLQGYYGATGVVGNYHMDYDPMLQDTRDSVYFHSSRNRFYGAWGFNGGLNFVIPFRNGSEWRVFGTEVSWTREFGDYRSLRSKLTDSIMDLVDRHRDFTTLGFSSDFVFKKRKGGTIGYKFGYVTSLTTLRNYRSYHQGPITPGYFSQTLHFSKNRINGYWQLNFGTYSVSSLLGVSYRF
ncbi:MAG: hypothetical protein QM731_27765 [Chitinophagaceae bacterium]